MTWRVSALGVCEIRPYAEAWEGGPAVKVMVIGMFIWCSQLLGASSGSVWDEAMAAADKAYSRGDLRQCLDSLRTALRVAESRPGSQLQLAVTLSRLGSVYVDLGSLRDAENAYLKAYAILNQAPPRDPVRSTVLLGLQSVYFWMGELNKSELYGRQAFETLEAAFGPEHPDLGDPLQGLAAIYQNQRRYSEAEELYRRALRLLEKGGSSFDVSVAVARGNLASLLAEVGRIEDAIAEETRAVRTMEAALGREHPRLAIRLANLATLYCRARQWTEAEEPARRARDIVVNSFGPQHPWLSAILKTYADVLRHTGRKREAKQAALTAETIAAEFNQRNTIGYAVDAASLRR